MAVISVFPTSTQLSWGRLQPQWRLHLIVYISADLVMAVLGSTQSNKAIFAPLTSYTLVAYVLTINDDR